MFGRSSSGGGKPIHEMAPAERLSEGLLRIVALHEYFKSQGVCAKLESSTLIVPTSIKNYFIELAKDEPRALKMQVIYDADSGDCARATLACSLATERSYAAKAVVQPAGAGYRLRFMVEIFVVDLSAFTSVVGLYQAAIEDCREEFIRIMTDTNSHD